MLLFIQFSVPADMPTDTAILNLGTNVQLILQISSI